MPTCVSSYSRVYRHISLDLCDPQQARSKLRNVAFAAYLRQIFHPFRVSKKTQEFTALAVLGFENNLGSTPAPMGCASASNFKPCPTYVTDMHEPRAVNMYVHGTMDAGNTCNWPGFGRHTARAVRECLST